MAFLRNLGKAVKIGVTAYITGGIAYWITAEIFIRYIGKEITFSPLVSALLAIPLWPLNVYGDLRWIGTLPQDVAALLVTIFTIARWPVPKFILNTHLKPIQANP